MTDLGRQAAPARRAFDPSRLTPQSRAAWECLADGRWHPRYEPVAAGAQFVLPGRAARKAGGLRGDRSPWVTVAEGQRLVALDGVRGLVRTGRLEQRRAADGEWEVRRPPGDADALPA